MLLNLSELHARRAENATDSGPFTEAGPIGLKVVWDLWIGSMIFLTDVLHVLSKIHSY